MLSLDPCMERFLGGGKGKAGWSVHTCHYMTCVSLLQCSHVGQTCKQDQLYIVFPEAGFEISVEPIDSHLICCHLQELLYFLILTGFMKHLKALKGIYIYMEGYTDSRHKHMLRSLRSPALEWKLFGSGRADGQEGMLSAPDLLRICHRVCRMAPLSRLGI